jgi:hypothetical protein
MDTVSESRKWKTFVASVMVGKMAVQQVLPTSPRSMLLTGSKLVHSTNGKLLIELAQVIYQSMYFMEKMYQVKLHWMRPCGQPRNFLRS